MTIHYSEKLVEWFRSSKRSFPWRHNRSAYTVLISEIMLQQTKACVVIPYFNSWLKKFPSFQALAEASEDEVIKAWEGLGYYSRARNLKTIAQRVVNEFNGEFPSDLETILSFKGIGPYTAAALSHFAFGKKAIGADGNIKKVMARFFGYKEPITKEKPILGFLDGFLPIENSSECFEGLIELGATVCKKTPICSSCPLVDGCKAFNNEMTHVLPVIKSKPKIKIIFRTALLISTEGGIYIKKEEGNLMKGLYALPFIESDLNDNETILKNSIEKRFGCFISSIEIFKNISHYFTKYKSVLTPIKCEIRNKISKNHGYLFVKNSEISNYPFSSGYRKILKQLSYI